VHRLGRTPMRAARGLLAQERHEGAMTQRRRELVPGEVLLLGTGEAFDDDLPNTSVLCQLGVTILVDCGPTVPPAVWKAVPDPNALDAIYVTHLHSDHTFGVPGVLFRLWQDGRRKPLAIIGQRGTKEHLSTLFDLAHGKPWRVLSYPLRFLTAEEGLSIRYRGVKLSFAETKHSVRNLAIRFDWRGKSLAISGDGSPTPGLAALYRNCGVVVQETYQDNVFEPVHTSMPAVLQLASETGIGRLYLVHLSREFKARADESLARQAPRKLRVSLGRPGQRIRL
jgi:ribonuclease BN (tRNA processing enzyme)